MPEDDENRDGGVGLGRTLALSDGVFAIAMTLLAFQLKAPQDLPSNGAGLANALSTSKMLDGYLVYFLSFAVIGLLWLAHHRIFRHVGRSDEILMRLNLLFLMVVAALPFPSSILGQYGHQGLSVILYAATMAVAGVLLTAMTIIIPRRGLLAPGAPPESMRRGTLRAGSMVIIFAVSIPVALVSPSVAPFIWLILLLRLPFDGRRRRKKAATSKPAAAAES